MTEWAEVAQTRQGLYRFFGEALLPPSKERLDLLEQAYPVLLERDLDRYAFSLEFRKFGKHLPVDTSATALEVEYVRLFASGMSKALSPPVESYYRVPGKGGGMAEFVADLQREYRSMGIISVGVGESPDHITTELEVMSFLCAAESRAWEEANDAQAFDLLAKQRNFLRRHLVVWIPLLRRRVGRASPVGFYATLVDAVHSMVVHDKDYVSSVLRGRESS